MVPATAAPYSTYLIAVGVSGIIVTIVSPLLGITLPILVQKAIIVVVVVVVVVVAAPTAAQTIGSTGLTRFVNIHVLIPFLQCFHPGFGHLFAALSSVYLFLVVVSTMIVVVVVVVVVVVIVGGVATSYLVKEFNIVLH